MIIAAGRGKLRQISLQGHQSPLAHLCFHSHTLSLCSTRTNRHACANSHGKRCRTKEFIKGEKAHVDDFCLKQSVPLLSLKTGHLQFEGGAQNPLARFCFSTDNLS